MAEIPTANIPVRSRDTIDTLLDFTRIVALTLASVALIFLILTMLDVRSAVDTIGQLGGTIEGGLGCGENFDEPC